MPSSLNDSETYAFQIVDNLTIRDVTQPVTFEATLTPASSERLEGSAITTIHYADWGITIPHVTMVASVSDDVQLHLEFVAVAA